jgi:hypothetical protein
MSCWFVFLKKNITKKILLVSFVKINKWKSRLTHLPVPFTSRTELDIITMLCSSRNIWTAISGLIFGISEILKVKYYL